MWVIVIPVTTIMLIYSSIQITCTLFNQTPAQFRIPCLCSQKYFVKTSRSLEMGKSEQKMYIRNILIVGSKWSEHILITNGDHLGEMNGMTVD